MTHQGILSRLKQRLRSNRLGELLVLNGSLSDEQLSFALAQGRKSGQQLGNVLVSENIVSRTAIRRTLIEQFTFQKASYHPKIFGSTEKRSTSLKAFTKWTGMFERFNKSLNSTNAPKEIVELRTSINSLKGLPLNEMASEVNTMMNKKRYVTDSANYGKSDYWATPIEFFQKGGDCEDFAIAKYTALRALGVPDNRMRIAIVQDQQKNVAHAILIVYTDQGAMILDNQLHAAVKAEKVSHYKPIFSINQNAWWLHTAPKSNVTRVASAAQ